MKQYLDILQYILDNGKNKGDRTGTGTISHFGYQTRFDLKAGFPLVTTKRIPFRLIAHELLWFLRGDRNIKYLIDNDVHIWNEWPFRAYLQATGQAIPKPHSEEWNQSIKRYVEKIKTDSIFAETFGDCGPIYGYQWRSWPTPDGQHIDQIKKVIERIKTKPDDRRLIVSAWNVADIEDMALPPCHCFFQFYVADGKLSCQMYQRSCDTFLGVPFNIASYALLTRMVAHVTGYEPGEFIWVGGDIHLYRNHIEQAKLQLSREPKPLPTLALNPNVKSIFDYKYKDFVLENYNPHPKIEGEISV